MLGRQDVGNNLDCMGFKWIWTLEKLPRAVAVGL